PEEVLGSARHPALRGVPQTFRRRSLHPLLVRARRRESPEVSASPALRSWGPRREPPPSLPRTSRRRTEAPPRGPFAPPTWISAKAPEPRQEFPPPSSQS